MAYRKGIWKDTCVICNKERVFNVDSNLYRFRRKGSRCNSCARRGQTRTQEQKNKIALATKHAMSQPEIWNRFMNSMRNETSRRKKRDAKLKRMQETGQKIEYNKLACKFFDMLNKEMNWNGLHAENGTEYHVAGYLLDYYEPNINVAIEWDERQHYKYGKLRDKDVTRQSIIMNELNCRFFRIKQDTFEITEVVYGN